ncbi:DUF3307 domain-containing protein [Pseudoalteromonas pernae]|uniref:DUF3307 domain-containing protein n=1 Tax=Pseudoalteromonas pernae TaxID=3118054 RepID=UPI003242A554
MDDQIALLLGLLLTHFIADFYLQPMSWVLDRNSRHFKSTKLMLHTLTHAALTAVVVMLWECYFGLGEWLVVISATMVIMVTHWLIDVAKSYTRGGIVPFFIDQIAHIVVIITVCLYLNEHDPIMQWLTELTSSSDSYVVLLAYLLVLNPCSVAIRMLLERWQLPQSSSNSAFGALPQAGHSIGLLERTLMLTFILIDELAGVGFVLAAKSVFRFGDLTNAKEKHLTEYVMLGTLLSVVFTMAIGLLARFSLA